MEVSGDGKLPAGGGIWPAAAMVLLGSLLLRLAGRLWWAVWAQPKSIERELRRQGIPGTSYRLFHGDLSEEARAVAGAWSRPIPLGHRIHQRASPFIHLLTQRYGKMAFTWKGTTARLVVRDPDLVKEILSVKDGRIVKPPADPYISLVNMGLAALEGEKWAKRKKLVMSAFHVEKLKGMAPAFLTSCEQLVKRWEEQVITTAGGSCEMDVWPEFQSLAGDVISRTAFGSCYEEGKKIFQLQKELLLLALEATRAVYIPGFRFIPTPKNWRMMHLDSKIRSLLQEQIRKREAAAMKNSINGTPAGGGGEDLLGLLLQSARDGDRDMTKQDVIEECKLFYFAGQETTAVLLTWAMVAMSMHTDWQHKAREEVLQLYGRNPPDIQNMNNLRTVSMVLSEVLRLYLPVATLFRHVHKEVKLPGGISIPAGVDLVMPTIYIHHDPDIWGEDADEFNPERFSRGVSTKAAGKEQKAFFPFGWGHRGCPGQSFAMIEAKMALSMILQRFSFELSPSYVHAPFTAITMQPQFGAQIILRRYIYSES